MQFYMKTGQCKFGITCKFHHPKDIQIQLCGEQNGALEQTPLTSHIKGVSGDTQLSNLFSSHTAPVLHNSKGLPVRLVIIFFVIYSLHMKKCLRHPKRSNRRYKYHICPPLYLVIYWGCSKLLLLRDHAGKFNFYVASIDWSCWLCDFKAVAVVSFVAIFFCWGGKNLECIIFFNL